MRRVKGIGLYRQLHGSDFNPPMMCMDDLGAGEWFCKEWDLRGAMIKGREDTYSLTGCDLRRAEFSGSEFPVEFFMDCDLRGARFVGAYLAGTRLWSCNVETAGFEGVVWEDGDDATFIDGLRYRDWFADRGLSVPGEDSC